MSEIKELVERAQTGDRGAFGELVERFQPTVYAIALARLRNPTEAQELAQEKDFNARQLLAAGLAEVASFASTLGAGIRLDPLRSKTDGFYIAGLSRTA